MRMILFLLLIFSASVHSQEKLSYNQEYVFGLYAQDKQYQHYALDIGKAVIDLPESNFLFYSLSCYKLLLEYTDEEEGAFAYEPVQKDKGEFVKILSYINADKNDCIQQFEKHNRFDSYSGSNFLYTGGLHGKIISQYGGFYANGAITHLAIKIDYPYPFLDCGLASDCSITYLHPASAKIMRKLLDAERTADEYFVSGDFFFMLEGIELNVKDIMLVHTVKEDDTLFSIAQKYKTTTEQVQLENGIESNIITIGQKLKIP